MEESKVQHLGPPKENSSPSVFQTVELKFSVPWGHIAAKAWGDHRGEPILAVHGLADNAATFDTLIPLLLRLVGRPLYIVSVDLPGHGHSSPLPPGIPYRFADMLGCLHRVITQLEWHQFSYLGHSLGGKTWGDPCGQPVLCVHGIQDNAGSFDRLIPLLPATFYCVCIDLPGHGYSSHFQEGFPLDFMDYVLSLIRVLDHLQWESCYYIGHSLGGQLGLYLCSLWPQRVRKLVLLDTVGPFYTRTDSYLSYNRLLLDNILRTEKQFSNKKKPVYTYQEAVDRIMTGRYSKLTEEAAKIMIRRSLMKSSDEGFIFTSDQRLKMHLASLLNEEQQLQILNGVKCPTLALLTSTPKIIATYPMSMTKHLELITSKQNFQRIDVKGNHDVHINNPEIVAPYIVRFLTKQRCGL